jgi:hypothetical protein
MSEKEVKLPTATKPADRLGRVAESRRMQMRPAEIRQTLQDGFSDPLHVHKKDFPEGMDLHWVRDSYRGEVDIARMSHMTKLGWEPVAADRYPDRIPLHITGRESPLSNYVHHRGLILCDRPVEWGIEEKRLEEEACYKSMITPAVKDSMVSADMRNAGWQTKVIQNNTMHEQEYRTFKE